MLAANADRDRAGDVLKAAYAEGRLTKDEYDYRVGRAVAARTVEELQQLTSDVPNGPSAVPPTFQRPFGQGQLVPFQPQPIAPYAVPRRQNGIATAALVCGIAAPVVSLVTAPIVYGLHAPYLFWLGAAPGVILGHKARAEVRRTRERGEGAATAGLMLGWVWLVLSGMLVLLLGAG
ncbi:hypothetical protein DB35_01795 [Streptomyces abyssalis]|uniref:Uncharacterized protein n=1 Tax=Streptomyces abyssalis TaxID=933944 RepID=A0A1E7JID7_9ACTN|nr:DUF1707 and DUF4190 domain-containing protein [Streptomyces abyssalis]OEU86221.1 hypothetical protein AN215_21710 [Streptomyces abyssalis]OEU95730.1 hypothetical protein DB35_01795 [Streptomyces abyssalis]OEV29875.1 hypothetical protein AN219_14225 [Streptomyces nanshensis]